MSKNTLKSYSTNLGIGLQFLRYSSSAILGNVADRLRIGIGVLDSDGVPVSGLERIDFCRFCELVRSTSTGCDLCRQSDVNRVKHCRRNYRRIDAIVDDISKCSDNEERVKLNAQFVEFMAGFTCPFRFLDICYPIHLRGEIRGYIFFGQIRCDNINPQVCLDLHAMFKDVFSRSVDSAPKLYADYLSKYFDTPRRLLGSDELISLYRQLRDYANVFSNMLDVCSLVDDAVSFSSMPMASGSVESTMQRLLEQSPVDVKLKGKIFGMSGRYVNLVAKDDYLQYMHGSPWIRFSLFTQCGVPDWLNSVMQHLKSADPVSSDSAEFKSFRLKGAPRKKHILVPLHISTKPIGVLVVYTEKLAKSTQERLIQWLRGMSPVVAGLLWREALRLFMQDLYRHTDLSPLAETVQIGIGEFIDLSRDGACALFWVEDSVTGNRRRGLSCLMPALPKTVRSGCGPGANENELWYNYGEGLTGWAWKYGVELTRCDTPLVFEGKTVRDGIEKFRIRLNKGLPGWPSWCKTRPQWAGKVSAKGESDAICPRPSIFVPITDGEDVLGVLRVTRPDVAFKESDIGFLKSIADHLGVVKRLHLAIHKSEDEISLNRHVHSVVDPLSAFVGSCEELLVDHLAIDPKVRDFVEHVRVLHAALLPTALWMKAVKAVGYVREGRVQLRQAYKARIALSTADHHDQVKIIRQTWLSPHEVRDQLSSVRLDAEVVPIVNVVKVAVQRFVDLRKKGNKKVNVIFSPVKINEDMIICDPEALCQLICETLENARKSVRDDWGDIASEQDILVEYHANDKGWAFVRVHDNGNKMNAALIEQLDFLPVEPHRVRLCTKGVGLEMNAVLAAIHGGWLCVEKSSKGFQKAVTLCLPTNKGAVNE